MFCYFSLCSQTVLNKNRLTLKTSGSFIGQNRLSVVTQTKKKKKWCFVFPVAAHQCENSSAAHQETAVCMLCNAMHAKSKENGEIYLAVS